MGLDGGTIVTRSDILRRSSIRLADGDKTRSTRGGCISHAHISEIEQDHPSIKYITCALSLEPLDIIEGIVACRLGYLYNISSLNDYLFKEGMFSSSRSSIIDRTFDHLRDIDDVVQCPNISLIKNPSNENEDSMILRCPATEILANGLHKFVVLWTCGCVMSEKVINMISKQSNKKLEYLDCPCCGCQFQNNKNNIIPLHPARIKVEHNDTVGAMIAKEKMEMITANNSLSLTSDSSLNISSSDRKRNRICGENIEDKSEKSQLKSEQLVLVDCIEKVNKEKKAKIKLNKFCVGSRAIQNSRKISKAAILKSNNVNTQKKKTKKNMIPSSLNERLLKEGWERLESKSKPGYYYYKNIKLKITQWEEPNI